MLIYFVFYIKYLRVKFQYIQIKSASEQVFVLESLKLGEGIIKYDIHRGKVSQCIQDTIGGNKIARPAP